MTKQESQRKEESPQQSTAETPSPSPEELAALQNPETQAAYRRAFLEQIRRQSCPGCGDSGPFDV